MMFKYFASSKTFQWGLLRADSLSMLLEVPEYLHTVLLEKCGPWPGLTELSLLGPVVAAQHICQMCLVFFEQWLV